MKILNRTIAMKNPPISYLSHTLST